MFNLSRAPEELAPILTTTTFVSRNITFEPIRRFSAYTIIWSAGGNRNVLNKSCFSKVCEQKTIAPRERKKFKNPFSNPRVYSVTRTLNVDEWWPFIMWYFGLRTGDFNNWNFGWDFRKIWKINNATRHSAGREWNPITYTSFQFNFTIRTRSLSSSETPKSQLNNLCTHILYSVFMILINQRPTIFVTIRRNRTATRITHGLTQVLCKYNSYKTYCSE